MPIQFRCTHCGQLHSISRRMAGKTVECPICRKMTVVPGEDQRPPDEDELEYYEEEGFQLQRGTSEFEELDMTPMVDVTFLLLIFFMITASFNLNKTLQFPPPEPDEEGAQQTVQTVEDFEADSIIVEIDEKNTIYVDDEPVSDPAHLADLLLDKGRTEQKFELLINADARSLHETVVKVVDAANEAGMQKIRLATTHAEGLE